MKKENKISGIESEAPENADETALEDFLKLDEDRSHKELKKIERGISAKIYRKTAVVIVLGAVTVLLLTFLTSQLAYLTHFNPKTSATFTLDNDNDDIHEFGLLMQTFVGMFMPDTYINVHDFGDCVKKTGFGNYEINAALGPKEVGYKGYTNGKVVIKWEKMYLESASDIPVPYFSFPAPFTWGEEPMDLLERVEELPDSSYLTVSLMFEEEKSISQMYDFMKSCEPSSRFMYLTAYAKEGAIPIGLDMEPVSRYGITGELAERYPDFYNEFTADKPLDQEAVANCYHSRIQLLIDNPEFFQLAMTKFAPTTSQEEKLNTHLQQELEKTADEITFIACRGYIKKADMLRMIESGELSLIDVHNVSLSGFSENQWPLGG